MHNRGAGCASRESREKKGMQRRFLISVMAALLGAAGCDDGGTASTPAATPRPAPPPAPIPTTVTVTPETAELSSPGATVQLAAEVLDQNGQVMTGVSVTWSSSDERTARVDETGLVTAVAGGMATITAMAEEASGTTEIMVIDMAWAAEFVARQHVVDGTVSISVRVNPDNCPAAEADSCERARYPGTGETDFGTFKAVTGVDTGIDTVGSREYTARLRDRIDEGRYRNARVVRTYADIETAHAAGDLALLFYIQLRPPEDGWHLNGDVAALRDWHDEGLRVLQLAYGSGRPDATAPGERLAYGHSEGEENGLTDLGRAAIPEMNRLGMIVDVSHTSRRSTLEAAALSTQPIFANHANAEALSPRSRNKDDDELLAIARTGGVIGVTPIQSMLDQDGDRKADMDDFIAHVEYIVALVGVDHVGISTDGPVNGWGEESWYHSGPDLDTADRWIRLTAELHARAWSEEDLAKLLGGNFLRVFREVLPPR